MTHKKEPDRSFGGTFIRDKDGNLLEHIPPTALAAPAEHPKSAEPKSSGKKGKE